MLTMGQMADYLKADALLKAAKDLHGDMKAEVNADFGKRYYETGDKSRDVLVDGEKLGTLTWVPGKPTEYRDEIAIIDGDKYMSWCEENGFVKRVTMDDEVQANFEATGEVPDGCAVQVVPINGRAGYVRATPTKEYKAVLQRDAVNLPTSGTAIVDENGEVL